MRRSAALAVGAALGASLLAACGGSPGPAVIPRASATGSGCGSAASPGSATLTVRVDGRERLAVVHVPTGYRDMTRTALVLNLHGSGSTAHQQELFSGMNATADAKGFLVAYPQGLIAAGTGYDWNVPHEPLVGGTEPPAGAANDVSFLVGLVGALEARYCIDAHRVYATGMSGGARMASQLACDAPDVFAAVAPVAGLRYPGPCSGRAVPILAFHGSSDDVDPYGGNGMGYWTYSVPTAAQRWAANDGCATTPRRTSAPGYTLLAYTGCTGGSTVELYRVTGEGHEWPGGPAMPAPITAALGPQSDAVDANATMWAFFAAHPLP